MRLPYELFIKYAISKRLTHKQAVEVLSLLKLPTPSLDFYNKYKESLISKEGVKIKVYFTSAKTDSKKQKENNFKEFLAKHGLLEYWEKDSCIIKNRAKLELISEYNQLRVLLNSFILSKRMTSDDIAFRLNTKYFTDFTAEEILDYKTLFWDPDKLNKMDWEAIIGKFTDLEEKKEYVKCLDSSFDFSTALKHGAFSRTDIENRKLDLVALMWNRAYSAAKSGASNKDIETAVAVINKIENKMAGGPVRQGISRGADEQEILEANFQDLSITTPPILIPEYTDLGADIIDITARIAEKAENE